MIAQEKRHLRTCDIVMKGGITSGVVYPKAIVTLAKRFQFKNLGGTSAGAIAAAATAAAEYRRTVHGCDKGFELLGKLGEYLGEIPEYGTQTRLFSLFHPNSGTRRLFTVLTNFLVGGKGNAFAKLGSALGKYPGAAFIGLLPGVLLVFVSLSNASSGPVVWLWVVVGILIGLAGAILAAAISFVREFLREIPRNNFGLCTGMDDPDSAESTDAMPLTIWLTSYLNEVAGFEPGHRPLTFGDLWGTRESFADEHPRIVNLEMMTTNLTHGRPYRLPLRDDDDLNENHLFYFRPDEFRRLFPDSVVQWMIENPRPISAGPDETARRQAKRASRAKAGYLPLPAPADLPVVVVTRMSLSFPFLLCAIPLHCIDFSRKNPKRMPERCWFTDGGLSSNFPLHFFDSPLPRRPTFSIDLTQKPDDTPDHELVPEMDRTNSATLIERWNRFDLQISADPTKLQKDKPDFGKLIGFVWTMISTMQNWNDATQGRMPGYRDRIVRIPLTSKQGGLNLDMPTELIAFLTKQGEACAEELMEHFDVPAHPSAEKMTWDNHRWLRLRATLAGLEKMADQILRACNGPESGDIDYETWLKSLLADETRFPKGPSYKATQQQIEAAHETLLRLRSLQALWADTGSAVRGSPKPRSVLRPRPQV